LYNKKNQLPQIANNVREDIKIPSTEKRFKRLIINPRVTEETFFLPFIQTLLKKLGLEGMVLAIDGSLVGGGCMCLMISLMWFNVNGHRVKRNFQQGQWDRQGPEIC
jgi:hypothetical protein